MPQLSPVGQAVVNDAVERLGFTPDAVTHVLMALGQGGGTHAQFDLVELGGKGQWSTGGKTMIGDILNTGLHARVAALCADLSSAMAHAQVFLPPESQQDLPEPETPRMDQFQPQPPTSSIDRDAIFDSLEKLGVLRDRGVLTDAEFDQKRADLLARL
ncbi:putative oligomerization/nucleic acid binding protein [Aliiruegeria haliotis]|uniref:Putative oligomerization/nucleic acid binding protein n=1 Tax=Aliiruegeria haliotis TaxID=1280846 RepID=A0A2T0RL47_9RHOB|nr:SHOCT domain-containing protein [Aliiruegeria haliotis]PRY21852.1 putative oligomerization/nucleic acid binding protein [Aliiruegeria haliotis]